MKTMFEELYYRLIELLKQLKTNDNPSFNAFIGISFFQYMNILSFGGIINYFLNYNISKNNAIYFGIFLYVLLTGINYVILFRKKEKITKKYEQLPIERQSKGKLYFWLYALSTTVLFIYVLVNLVTPNSASIN